MRVDLRSKFPEIYKQGSHQTCLPASIASVYQYYNNIKPSILYLYYNIRMDENGDIADNGIDNLHTTERTLNKYGIVPEKYWPYNDDLVYTKPTDEIYKIGKEFLKNNYIVYNHIYETSIKSYIINGNPIIMSFYMFSNIYNSIYVDLPEIGDKLVSCHVVVIVGFDDDLQFKNSKGGWICRNHWGENWGDKGYCYIPYTYTSSDTTFYVKSGYLSTANDYDIAYYNTSPNLEFYYMNITQPKKNSLWEIISLVLLIISLLFIIIKQIICYVGLPGNKKQSSQLTIEYHE